MKIGTTVPEGDEQEAPRTWRVTFHDATALIVTAHDYEVDADGDVAFTTYLEDGTELMSCSVARTTWRSVELVADGSGKEEQ